VPASIYTLDEVYAEYRIVGNRPDDFLSILLERVEEHYGLADFERDFTQSFELFLQSADIDPDTEGTQPYLDPSGDPILTLADTLWFGPAVTWPRELFNHPYIEFWHQLDAALLALDIPGMGPEALGDDAWAALFSSGYLWENRSIIMSVNEAYRVSVRPLDIDQLGSERPAGGFGDIGAIESP
jgi:hypothetical protein